MLRREREDKEDEGKKEGEEQKDNQKKRVSDFLQIYVLLFYPYGLSCLKA